MSIRIYALAKELKIDNKTLMDLCGSIGVMMQSSSALGSISDEDAQRVREAHVARHRGHNVSAPEVVAPEPPRQVVTGRVPTLPTRSKRTVNTAKPSVTSESSATEEWIQEASSSGGKTEAATVIAVEKVSSEESSARQVSSEKKSLENASSEKVSSEPAKKGKTKEAESAESAQSVSEMKEKDDLKPSQTQEKEVPPEKVSDTKVEEPLETVSSKKEKEEKSSSGKPVAALPSKKGIAEKPEGKPTPENRSGKSDRNGSRGRDDRGRDYENRKNDRRSKGPVKGSSPNSTPLGMKLSRKNRNGGSHVQQPTVSVTETIAAQAGLATPVRPTFENSNGSSFPSLHTARKIRREDAESKDPRDIKEGEERNRDERSRPTIRLAPLPAAKLPPKKPREVQAQKPDIRLPLDAIRAGKSGDDSMVKRVEQELLEKNRRERGEKPRDGKSKDSKVKEKGKERTEDKKPRRSGEKVAARPPVLEESSTRSIGKKGKKGTKRGESAVPRDTRLTTRRKGAGRSNRNPEDEENANPRWRKMHRTGTNTAAPRKSSYVLQLPLTVRSFSESVGLSAAKVLGKLFEMGVPTTITAGLDETTALLLADSFGVPVEIKSEVTLEEKLIGGFQETEDEASELQSRPPIVTFLGHVDHGKTSLLDRIINIDVVSGEKGGITQHIRAYNVKYADRSVTFVDTPGHEAFTEMRARGANCTDIAVLVVAADDGVMPQTEEAISHAKAAGVPIIVALNKMDLPGVNEMKILQELSTNELTPSDWGGDVEVVRCSALTGMGIDDLMETILTVAELNEYRANPDKPGSGVCIESSVQQGRGVIAKLLVRNGTLHTGDVVVCGSTYGRVKVMADTLVPRKRYTSAGPAIPVNVLGLDSTPGAGDKFYVLEDIADARRLAEERSAEERMAQLAGTTKTHVTLEGLFDTLGSKEVQTLNVILRADVRGSIEAIRKELGKLEHDEVQIRILQASVGGVTEADVHLADASDAIIVGFNVVPDENARVLAEQKGVQVRRYDIIYQLTADIRAALEGMLKPEEREKELGRALVQKTFQITRVGMVAGCRVLSGTILRDSKVRIIRDSRIIGVYPLDTLKREKDDVKEVREGYECGIRLAGFNDVKEGDVLQAYQVETIARTFS